MARDIAILSSRHIITEHQYFSLSPGNLWRGFRAVANADLVLIWFASQRAVPMVLAALLTGKPVITIVGGYEAANCPDIDYGSARFARLRAATRWILKRSRRIIAVSHSSHDSIVRNLGIAPEKITIIYHGFEDSASQTLRSERNTVLTVGRLDRSSWLVKGLRDFFLVAQKMPNFNFVHVGNVAEEIKSELAALLAPNVHLAGEIPFAELGKFYSAAKVYLQPSRHESFGCAVAEAMLYGCIPVVRRVYALPEVVGNTGVIFEGESLESIVAAVRMAMSMDSAEGGKARGRILEQFSYQRRESTLLDLVDSVS